MMITMSRNSAGSEFWRATHARGGVPGSGRRDRCRCIGVSLNWSASVHVSVLGGSTIILVSMTFHRGVGRFEQVELEEEFAY